jgi:hypothetical protein
VRKLLRGIADLFRLARSILRARARAKRLAGRRASDDGEDIHWTNLWTD